MAALPTQAKRNNVGSRLEKILIIDDDKDILHSLADLLEYQGNYMVLTADSAAAAKKTVRHSCPRLALVDVKLGRDNGLDLISELKEIQPELICITMTAFRDAEQTPQAVRSGADDFLYKPMDSAKLLKTLSHHLNHQDLLREKYETERRFRGVFDQTFQLLFLLEPDGTLIEANATALNFAGTEKSKTVGRLFWETPWWRSPIAGIPATNSQRIKQAVAEASLDEFIHYETEMRNSDGNMVAMDFSLKPILNESGKVTLLIAESRDLSQYKTAENALRESEMQVRLLLESTTEGICGIDMDGNCTFANSKCLELLGYMDIDELLGNNLHELIYHVHDQAHNDNGSGSSETYRIDNAFLENRSLHSDNEMFRRQDGSSFPVEYRADPIRRHGSILGAVVTFTDITARKEAEKSLVLAGKVTESAAEAIIVTDSLGVIVDTNPALTRQTGYSREEVIGKDPFSLVSQRYDGNSIKQLQSSLVKSGKWSGELWLKRLHGDDYPVRASINAARDSTGQVTHYVGLYTDISEIKRAEQRLEQLAHYDSLTELPNRALFQENLDMALSSAKRHVRHLALLFIDLDRFKQVNDTLGHKFGDKVLRETARRLCEVVRTEDTVSRLSGDEFTIILSEISDPVYASTIAQRVVESLSRPFNLFGEDIYISASVGLALYPEDGLEAETLLRNADLAMYHAKAEGGNGHQFFNKKINSHAREKHLLETGLRHAINKEEFYLFYQPIFDLNNRQITGFGTQLHWQHRQVGEIPPHKFLTIAEETGLILPIGQMVLKQACWQAQTWWKEGLPRVPITVTISARQFQDKKLLSHIKEILEETALEPELLELELSETVIMNNIEKNISTLEELKQMGLRISLDTYGTGYSSLRHLKRLPIDTIKIDHSLVADISDNMEGRTIVSSIIIMARNMDLNVTAEGVETQEQLDMLKQFGCNQGQGPLLGKAAAADQLFDEIKSTSNTKSKKKRKFKLFSH